MKRPVVWLSPGTWDWTVRDDPSPSGFHLSRRQKSARTWTLDELLTSPAPGEPVTVHLLGVVGGHTIMAAHGGVLYVALIASGLKPNDRDRLQATRLGFTL